MELVAIVAGLALLEYGVFLWLCFSESPNQTRIAVLEMRLAKVEMKLELAACRTSTWMASRGSWTC